MRAKRILWIVLICLAAAAACSCLWLNGSFLPKWASWQTAEITEDLDADGTMETVLLKNRHLTVKRGGEVLYSSPLLWRVSDVFTGDIDADGYRELIFLVWKHGSYGKNRPFWVEHDTIAFSQHVFIFRLKDNKISSVWMSSDIGRHVSSALLDEDLRLHLTEPEGEETVWEWLDWGLVLFWQGAAGTYEENRPDRGQTKTGPEEAAAEDTLAEPEEAAAEDTPVEPGEVHTVTLIAVGDNIAHASVYERAFCPETGTFDFSPVYARVRRKISSYNIAVINQETVFVEDPAFRSDYPLFATPASMGDALVSAGFDVITAATNHSFDRGTDGVLETLAFWEANYPEITVLGLHNSNETQDRICCLEKNGIRLALFNYTETLNGAFLPEDRPWLADLLTEKDRLLEQLALAETKADLSICFLHVGEEYSKEPSEELISLAEELAAAGADAVIATHPHVLQRVERITAENGNSAIVYWSLGNFMSNQTDPETLLGGAAVLTIEKQDGEAAVIRTASLLPTVCHFDGNGTTVYFLEDYTEELAKEHSLNREKPLFTRASLQEQFDRILGDSEVDNRT